MTVVPAQAGIHASLRGMGAAQVHSRCGEF